MPGQGNNAYVFPGIGLGAVACRARTLPDELFLPPLASCRPWSVAAISTVGALYPPLRDQEISLAIAVGVAESVRDGRSQAEAAADIRRSIEALIYTP